MWQLRRQLHRRPRPFTIILANCRKTIYRRVVQCNSKRSIQLACERPTCRIGSQTIFAVNSHACLTGQKTYNQLHLATVLKCMSKLTDPGVAYRGTLWVQQPTAEGTYKCFYMCLLQLLLSLLIFSVSQTQMNLDCTRGVQSFSLPSMSFP